MTTDIFIAMVWDQDEVADPQPFSTFEAAREHAYAGALAVVKRQTQEDGTAGEVKLEEGQTFTLDGEPLDLYEVSWPAIGEQLVVAWVVKKSMDSPDVAEDVYARRLAASAKILSDLDRCPHGRHRGDTCAGWRPGEPMSGCEGGRSLGNPHLPAPGQVVGYDLYGGRYVVPADGNSTFDPESWRPPGTTPPASAGCTLET